MSASFILVPSFYKVFFDAFRPFRLRVEPNIGHAGQSRLDVLNVFLQQLLWNLSANPERQLLAFFFGLHRFRCELCDIGNEGYLRGDRQLWCCIEHQPNIRPYGGTACFGGWQEKRHVDVTQIDEVQDPAA
ncbi:hypothetical protein D3C80_1630040 [compost metagenome]